MVGEECVIDIFTQTAGGTPNPVARPPLDDAGVHSGKPPKAIKTQSRQMQPLGRLILYGVMHYEVWSESLPHDLMNMAVYDVLKRVTEARVSEHIPQELQCPRSAHRTWLGPATSELWIGDKLRVAERLFRNGGDKPWYGGVDVAQCAQIEGTVPTISGPRAKWTRPSRVAKTKLEKPLMIGWMKMMSVMRGKNGLRGTPQNRRKKSEEAHKAPWCHKVGREIGITSGEPI